MYARCAAQVAGFVGDDDVDDGVLDVHARLEAGRPEGSKRDRSNGWLEHRLVEPLIGAEVDAHRAVDEHGREREARGAEAGAHDSGAARRGGEDRDAK
jgi:hypothetical protein